MITKCIVDANYICLADYKFCNCEPMNCGDSKLSADFLDEIPTKPNHVTTFAEYQDEAHKTCMDNCWNEAYLSYGLISEIGEIADKLKKNIRDGNGIIDDEFKKCLAYEIGDCAWYLAELGAFEGCWLREMNIDSGNMSFNYEIFDIVVALNISAASYVEQGVPDDLHNAVKNCQLLATELGYTFEQILNINLEKLASRKIRNKIKGEGDNR